MIKSALSITRIKQKKNKKEQNKTNKMLSYRRETALQDAL